jgi:hypothetical protein
VAGLKKEKKDVKQEEIGGRALLVIKGKIINH